LRCHHIDTARLLPSPVRERSIRVVGAVDALAADRRILDLHAGVWRQQRPAESDHRVGWQHPPLAEAREPDDDHLELPAAVVGPRVDDTPDVLSVAVLNLQSEQVPP
jgi:hypothetical protein